MMNKINETTFDPKSFSLSSLEKAYTYNENSTTTLLGHQFIVHPDVFNPEVFISTHKIVGPWINLIRTIRPDTLLEIGTGAGYISILSALNGANKITATDITSQAIANAKANIDKYNMNDRIRLIQGNIFEPLDQNEKFDVIFWSVPFSDIDKPVEELNSLECSLFDPNYQLTETYIQQAHKYLNNNGRLFISASKVLGNFQRLTNISNTYGWRLEMVQNSDDIKSKSQDTNNNIDANIYELIQI